MMKVKMNSTNMKKWLKRFYKFWFHKKTIPEIVFDGFVFILERIKHRVSIRDIDKMYNLYSSPFYEGNKQLILEELALYGPLDDFKIDYGDFIAVDYLEIKNQVNILLVVVSPPNHDPSSFYFFEDKNDRGIPDFSVRKFLVYSDGYFYDILDINRPPVFISEEIIKELEL